MNEGARKTPLIELARSIPQDLRAEWESQWHKDGTPCGHTMAPVGKYLHDMADEIERLQQEIERLKERNALLEEVAAAAEAVSLCKGQTLLGCAPDNDYPNVPDDEMKAHEYGAFKAFNQCASIVKPALDKLKEVSGE